MAEDTHTDLSLVGRHIPESSIETDANGNKHSVQLPGFYEIGVYIDGAWQPIFRRKAAGLFADIKRAKENAPEQDETTGEQSQPSGSQQSPTPYG